MSRDVWQHSQLRQRDDVKTQARCLRSFASNGAAWYSPWNMNIRICLLASVASCALACTSDVTPVGTVLGVRDFNDEIPGDIRGGLTDRARTHRFRLGETAAEVEARFVTAVHPNGSAWVRTVEFVVVKNSDQQIQPPGVMPSLNLGTTERPVASYSFLLAYNRKSWVRTKGGTVAGRFAGDGAFEIH